MIIIFKSPGCVAPISLLGRAETHISSVIQRNPLIVTPRIAIASCCCVQYACMDCDRHTIGQYAQARTSESVLFSHWPATSVETRVHVPARHCRLTGEIHVPARHCRPTGEINLPACHCRLTGEIHVPARPCSRVLATPSTARCRFSTY